MQPMTLGDFISEIEKRRKTITVYAPEGHNDIAEQFASKNVSVEYEPIPEGGPEGFVVIRDRDGFAGSSSLSRLAELTTPPIPDLGAEEEAGYRALFELLDDTLFTSFDRRQLLATSREIEDRAYRVGRGTLHVGFQNLSSMRNHVSTYERLVEETDLDVHVYGRSDWDPPAVTGVKAHADPDGDVGRFWFLVFDGGGEAIQKCALLAEERSPGEFYGFWTYDPTIVDGLLASLGRIHE